MPTLFRYCLQLVALIISSLLLADTADSELPPMTWEVLEFERKSTWGDARSRLSLSRIPAAELSAVLQQPGSRSYLQPNPEERVQELKVEATVGTKNQVSLQLLMHPETQALYQRSRFSIGRKDRRFKFFRYAEDGLTRLRKDPADKKEAKLPQQQWSRSSSTEVNYSEELQHTAVTSPFALFVILSRLTSEQLAQQPVLLVNTDTNVYKVTLSPQPTVQLDVKYNLTRTGQAAQRRKETVDATPVKLLVAPTALASNKPDFELMGLSGEITVFVDSLDHTPLRVAGIAPRVGAAHLDIANAVLVERQEPSD
ncbi:hypothetical protein EYC98_16285 [Halieaceae bacterium IMCC14734]|uniref:Uncharacterized protein n=1 Tax=Candidatus Litorirhabdus singularis TaxID=2518993 RepID=A0ABT3TJC9_9GAMM|nr:hypothetical protein [Candidatus Litorirhabdus singularis]MCX2982423.1 hypothetical protein [Candidatus Litorirhabdus singularis]